MSKRELLNNVTHKDLRINTQKSAQHGDNVGGAILFPQEFTEAQKEYPIFFQKDAQTGEFQAVAVFGFNENENLFLDESGWHANYIPAVIEREPFLIGFQSSGRPEDDANPMIHVDLSSSRISKDSSGQSVFLEQGGNTAYLDRVSTLLMMIHEGFGLNKGMFDAFLSLDLIEPFMLDITFNNGLQYQSQSYYTIHQEKFFALDDVTVGKLHREGYLHFAYMVIASTTNVRNLIEKKNKIQGKK